MSEVLFDSSETKNILMSANTFHTLKKNLYNNIGSYKTKGFLFRLGKEFGMDSAKRQLQHQNQKNSIGKRHSRVGHVKDVIFKGEIVRHPNGKIECINTRGQWVESIEAELHLKNFGVADECVCHMLCGFASGALTYEFGESLIAIEHKCTAKGDPCCEFELRLEKDWLEEKQELIHLYQNDNILSELEMTYDALLHHKQILEKIAAFQSQLTQKVTEKQSLDEITQAAFEILNIPILIKDIHDNSLSQIGFTDEQQLVIKKDKATLSYIDDNHNVSHYEGSGYLKLTAPVIIDKKNYATCSFYYFDKEKIDDNDYLFLERIATVASLCILYEEAQFEEQQRMRSSLLERLIHNQNIKDIESYYKFLPFKFQPPFFTGVISVQKVKKNNDIIDIHDQLIQLSKLAKESDMPCIFAIIGEDIALLNSQNRDKEKWKEQIIKIFRKMEKRNSNYKYTLGLSGIFSNFNDFERSLKEARTAKNYPNQKLLTDYEDLGILGDIVKNLSMDQLQEMAKKTLKNLYDFNEPRKKELLYTLYVYLLNSQRLKETMDELTLSIGGIQYRIKQIEEQLEISLKNASTAAYILLVIQALILADKLSFEEFSRS
ncbi:helix-turn-helix domain-containing protein [Bacillus sp. AGMB 02131]|uniref:Helix-turn-helix domain-containing protein n=1 Tax=Peribacillus faecalis TaxID=2772559 RepID=A0A927CSV6_9BACI|nr:V4R domain-containing protein [Peribacillus faecalis]MBD3107253.1 helix-turn-helix domain-containing protein [Peribacillus faecalis]